MNSNYLNAVAYAVGLYRGVYDLDVALDCAAMSYRLDEYQREDLHRHVLQQATRLDQQEQRHER